MKTNKKFKFLKSNQLSRLTPDELRVYRKNLDTYMHNRAIETCTHCRKHMKKREYI